MPKPRKHPKKRPPRTEDLRIPATPEELARRVVAGGAAPRPETKPAHAAR